MQQRFAGSFLIFLFSISIRLRDILVDSNAIDSVGLGFLVSLLFDGVMFVLSVWVVEKLGLERVEINQSDLIDDDALSKIQSLSLFYFLVFSWQANGTFIRRLASPILVM